MTLIYTHKGRSFWMSYDGSAAVYELFASREGDDYLGCFDSRRDALAFAKAYHADNR